MTTHEQDRRNKLDQIRALGFDPYSHDPLSRINPIDVVRKEYKSIMGKNGGPFSTVAGRILLRRGMGKLSFITLQSEDGSIQVAFDHSALSEEHRKLVKLLDLGDIIIASGNLGATNTGEITIWATELRIVSKSLLPPPDKVEGFKEPEARYRNRHVELWSNPDLMKIIKRRFEVVARIRDFLNEHQFLEVETPIMQNIAGGAIAKPFVTHHNALDIDLYLRIAPELYLKKLLMGGFTKIYEIGKNFRNEGISNKHNPEFTALELYEAFGDYRSMMNLLEEMITCRAYHSFDLLAYGEHQISFSLPYRRVRLNQLVEQGTPEEQLRVYENEIEKTLINPTFVTHLPCSAMPLAKESKNYPGYAEVFELVIAGQEVGTGYTELNDPDVQLRNFQSQTKDGHCLDMEFVNAMKAGMPPAGGLGLGIDRLVAIITNQQNIRDIIPFPLLKEVSHDTIKT